MAYNVWSGMFGTGSNNSFTGVSGLYSSLGDYSSIKSGSYKKVLTAYYKNTDSDSTTKTATNAIKKTNNTTVNQTMTDVKKKTDALQDAASTLLETGKDSVFASEDKTKMVSAVKSFVTAYNNTLTEAADASDDVATKATYMTNSTNIYKKDLEAIGITIGDDNKLSVDEEILKSAETTKVKQLMNSSSSFVGQTVKKAMKIGAAAQNVANGVGTYSSTGTYNFLNMSDYFNTYF